MCQWLCIGSTCLPTPDSCGAAAHGFRLPCCCSIDIPGMFEAKGVAGAAGRLTLMSGDVRQPFPQQAQQAQVRAWRVVWCSVVR